MRIVLGLVSTLDVGTRQRRWLLLFSFKRNRHSAPARIRLRVCCRIHARAQCTACTNALGLWLHRRFLGLHRRVPRCVCHHLKPCVCVHHTALQLPWSIIKSRSGSIRFFWYHLSFLRRAGCFKPVQNFRRGPLKRHNFLNTLVECTR